MINKNVQPQQQEVNKQADSKEIARRYLELMRARHKMKNKKQFTRWLDK